ncbi:hypothetical protein CYLTODRAFT_384801, partial [Cylindrobasidium torrendii FP15055 ss-10]
MDDYYGWDYNRNLVLFHGRRRPCRQVQLLILWDYIDCPWGVAKQDHGHQLKIIGFWVDIVVGSIALSPESISLIIVDINRFLDTEDRRPPLIDWQKLGGYLNWALNVMPWARPALACLYNKMRGKVLRNGRIPLNATVHERMHWFIDVAKVSTFASQMLSLQW